MGGDDAGANPVEFVLAALVGCLNVVIHTVAKEKGVEVPSPAPPSSRSSPAPETHSSTI
ncbi:OsmC family protein [Brachybacterium muris]|uniref:OsmC family protein n=1 Tax=Brachybacterium muris TaxID=219301 RepID=UPI00351F8404